MYFMQPWQPPVFFSLWCHKLGPLCFGLFHLLTLRHLWSSRRLNGKHQLEASLRNSRTCYHRCTEVTPDRGKILGQSLCVTLQSDAWSSSTWQSSVCVSPDQTMLMLSNSGVVWQTQWTVFNEAMTSTSGHTGSIGSRDDCPSEQPQKTFSRTINGDGQQLSSIISLMGKTEYLCFLKSINNFEEKSEKPVSE